MSVVLLGVVLSKPPEVSSATFKVTDGMDVRVWVRVECYGLEMRRSPSKLPALHHSCTARWEAAARADLASSASKFNFDAAWMLRSKASDTMTPRFCGGPEREAAMHQWRDPFGSCFEKGAVLRQQGKRRMGAACTSEMAEGELTVSDRAGLRSGEAPRVNTF